MEENNNYTSEYEEQDIIIEDGDYSVGGSDDLLLKGLEYAMIAVAGIFFTFVVGITRGSASFEHMGTKINYKTS